MELLQCQSSSREQSKVYGHTEVEHVCLCVDSLLYYCTVVVNLFITVASPTMLLPAL